jgi:hypothetical protein
MYIHRRKLTCLRTKSLLALAAANSGCLTYALLAVSSIIECFFNTALAAAYNSNRGPML